MSEKIKIVNNVAGALYFYLNPSAESLKCLKKQGLFWEVTSDELDYVYINQEIIQKGMLWVDNKAKRVEYGIENEDGEKQNLNVLQHDEVKDLITGNYKKLEKVLGEITEKDTLIQFVEVARELKIDSKTKIDLIEKASGMQIFIPEE